MFEHSSKANAAESLRRAVSVLAVGLAVGSLPACASVDATSEPGSEDDTDIATGTSDESAALTQAEANFVGIYENGSPAPGGIVRLTLEDDNTFESEVDVRNVALCRPGQSCTEKREGTWTLRRSGSNHTLRLRARQRPVETHTLIAGATEALPVRLVRGTLSQELSRRPLKKVAGYDFGGDTILRTPGPQEACPAVLSPVSAACVAAGGQTRRAEGCNVVCSHPIATGGAVAGFDFSGLRTAAAAPAGQMCTTILRPEEEACLKGGGRALRTSACGVLCTQPIAANPKVAGFDFSGLRSMNGPQPNVLCSANNTAVSDACSAAGGRVVLASGCTRLCTVPVARGMEPAELRLEPVRAALFSIPNAHPNPSCFVATRIDLGNGFAMPVATIEEFVGGSCGLTVVPNTRRYSLSLVSHACGSNVYEGTGRDEAGNSYSVRVTDHRERYCEDIVPAVFVVEETRAGGIARTKYSY